MGKGERMNDLRVDHVGYLVKNVDKAVAEFEALGYALRGDVCHDEIRCADIAFIEHSGYVIELVAPCDEASVAWNLLRRNGSGPYHICYETENLKKAEALLQENGGGGVFMKIQDEQDAPALGGRKVAFFVNKNIGMVELVEKKEEKK
jgi:methylmalonyl-CoA/ethylmalonyl-CoA epimerase